MYGPPPLQQGGPQGPRLMGPNQNMAMNNYGGGVPAMGGPKDDYRKVGLTLKKVSIVKNCKVMSDMTFRPTSVGLFNEIRIIRYCE